MLEPSALSAPSSKLKKRTYLVKFRFVTQNKTAEPLDRLWYRHFMPKWSMFLKECMKIPLSKQSIRDLPALRVMVPTTAKVEDIFALLKKHNSDLARLLVEAAPIFDVSAHDLKVHIIASFEVRSDNPDLMKIW